MSPSPYHLLKAAQALFGKAAEALTEAERAKAAVVARRHAEIEHAVLASPEARGVCVPAGACDAALAEIRARYDDASAFAGALAAEGLDPEGFAAALHRDLLVDAVLARVGAAAGEVGETETEIFYYAHLARFRAPEKRVARHILVTVNEKIPGNDRASSERRIREIARRLAAKPGRFEEQAMKHSECPTALSGGLLGEVPRGRLFPELEAALFALPAGGTSGPVESELGYHLLRCDRILPERTVPYAEVAASLRQRLTEERAHRSARKWLATLLAPSAARAA